MSSEIILCLQLDKKFDHSRTIAVKEIKGCDSSFIVNCILSHNIKNNSAVLVISSHNSIQHYQNVGLKMNYNLLRHTTSGLIEFVNIGDNIVNSLFTENYETLESVFLSLKNRVLEMQKSHGVVSIIFDGVSHLFDMGFSLIDVNIFCNQLYTLVRDSENSFVIYHCNVATEDDVTHVMANMLAHKAHTVLEVESLATGLSMDVSGHLVVKHPGQKFDNDKDMFTLDMKPSRYLFKLFDRGVKLMARGSM